MARALIAASPSVAWGTGGRGGRRDAGSATWQSSGFHPVGADALECDTGGMGAAMARINRGDEAAGWQRPGIAQRAL